MRPGEPTDPTVRRLRRRLARIDRSLVRALTARERAQWELLERKQRRSLPLLDVGQEERVRRRAREWAQELGGDPALAEKVVTAAVASGKARFISVANSSKKTLAAPVEKGVLQRRSKRKRSVPSAGLTRTFPLEDAPAP